MNKDEKQQLIEKLANAVSRLDEYEEGPLAIGQIGIAINELVDVIKVLIEELGARKEEQPHNEHQMSLFEK